MRSRIAGYAAVLVAIAAAGAFALGMGSAIHADAKSRHGSRNQAPARPGFTIVRESRSELTARIVIPKAGIGRSVRGTSVVISGTDRFVAPGQPDLPVIRRLVAVPECASISVKAKGMGPSVLSGVSLSASRRASDGSGDCTDGSWRASGRIANADPGYLVRVQDAGYLRGQRVAVIEFFPVQYSAGRREVTAYETIELTLGFHSPSSDVHVNVGPMEHLLQRLLLNPPPPTAGPEATARRITSATHGSVCWIDEETSSATAASVASCGADYLMIVADTLSHGTDSLKLHELATKRASYNRFNVAIVRLSSITDCGGCVPDITNTPGAIRDFIRAVYAYLSAGHMGDGRLGYVLLVGDAYDPEQNVLMPLYYQGTPGSLDVGDGYYALLSEEDPTEDPFPDVFLGRFPVDADTAHWELNNVIQRTLAYEPLPDGAAWLDKVLLVSGGKDTGYSFAGEGLDGFKAFFDSTEAYFIPANRSATQMHFLDPAYYGSGVFSQAVCDSIRSGYGVVTLFSHGEYFYLAGADSFYATRPIDYDALNTDYPPLLFTIGSHLGELDYTIDKVGQPAPGGGTGPCVPSFHGLCVPGQLDQYDVRIDSCDVLAERFLVQEKGAIGVIALNRTMAAAAVEGALQAFFEGLYEQNAMTLGEALMIPKLLGRLQSSPWNRGLALLGDPAVSMLWTDVEHDSVDLAIRGSDIGRYVSSSEGRLTVTVRNQGSAAASNVEVEVWLGHPDSSGSTLVGSGTVGAIAGYDTVVTSVPVELPPGRRQVFAYVNPEATIAEMTRDNNIASAYCHALPYMPGFPIQLEESARNNVVLADVDGEPGSELLFATSTRVHCYRGDGAVVWTFGGGTTPSARTAPAVANVYKDGRLFVICELAEQVYILEGATGSAVDSVAVGSAGITPSPSHLIGDLVTHDGELELLLRVDSSFVAKTLDGSTLWSATPASGTSYAGTAICDLDRDGSAEVVIASGGVLAAYDAESGATKWGPVSLGGVAHTHQLAACDGDGDGYMEIVVTNFTGTAPGLALYDHEGNRLWAHQLDTILFAPGLPYFAVGDLSGAGAPVIVAAYRQSIRSISWNNTLEDSVHVPNIMSFGLDMLLADVTGDASLEVIVPMGRTVATVPFTDRSDAVLGIFDADLGLIDSSLVFAEGTVNRMAAGDIEGNGIPAVCAITSDNILHVARLGDKVGGTVPWGMFDIDAMHTNVYAQPLVGSYDSAVSLFNRVDVLGDVAFLGPVYVDGTAELRVRDEDLLSAGVDTLRTELWVHDEFRVVGSEHRPVRIVGWDGVSESSDPTAWWAIFVSDSTGNARGDFKHCEIRDAQFGLQARESVSLKNCLIEDCAYLALSVAPVDTVVVDDTTIRGSEYGINALLGTHLILSNSTIEDCSLYGVALYKNAVLEATGTTFGGNDVGLYLSSETEDWVTATVRNWTFTENTDGIWIEDVGDSVVVIDNCTITNSTTTGIYVEDPGDVRLARNTITGGTVGVYSYGSSPRISSRNVIEDNASGIKCDNFSYAAVESCTVTNNTGGVVAINDANPDLGHVSGGSSSGYNILHPNTNYFVTNVTTNTIKAEINYWAGQAPNCYPKASKIFGNVDYAPALCSAPTLSAPAYLTTSDESRDLTLPRVFNLGHNYPNPFNPTTTVSYQVPPPGAHVRIELYDVAGRLVATLVNEEKLAGTYETVWKGRNHRGQPVASGVYFLRMLAGSFVQTRKLVVLK